MRLYLLSTLAAVLASQSLPGQSAIPLTAFSQSLEALAARVDPAVVQIVSTGYGRGDESQRGSASLLTRQRSTGCLLYTSPSHETGRNLVCRLLLEKKKNK